MEARPFDEAATLARLGIAYRNIPVNAGSLDDATMAAVLAALREAAGTPTMLHCASANRVGAIWLPYRVLDEGIAYDAALAEAKTVGLRNSAMEAKAKAYIERKKN